MAASSMAARFASEMARLRRSRALGSATAAAAATIARLRPSSRCAGQQVVQYIFAVVGRSLPQSRQYRFRVEACLANRLAVVGLRRFSACSLPEARRAVPVSGLRLGML